MKIRILSRLSILMETVEMLYKYVNNLSLDNIKRDFLLKYGEQLGAEDRAYYDTLFQALDSIIEEGTREQCHELKAALQWQVECFTFAKLRGKCLPFLIGDRKLQTFSSSFLTKKSNLLGCAKNIAPMSL